MSERKTSRPDSCTLAAEGTTPRSLRLLVISLATLILCSCQTLSPRQPASGTNASLPGKQNSAPGQDIYSDASGNLYHRQAPWKHHGNVAEEMNAIAGENAITRNPTAAGQQVAHWMPAADEQAAAQPADYNTDGIKQTLWRGKPLPRIASSCGCPGCSNGGCQAPFSAAQHDESLPRRNWPADEYLCDGGDSELPAKVKRDWSVQGLEQEDTVAHFDTLDGRTLVQPSNRVCIYAPRFQAVRRVDNTISFEQTAHAIGVQDRLQLKAQEHIAQSTTALQPVQPVGQRGTKASSTYRLRQQGGGLDRHQHLSSFTDRTKQMENLHIIRDGIFDQAEKARLANMVDAAITWSHDKAVQVILEGKQASQLEIADKPAMLYRVQDDRNNPELRIVKIASTKTAQPGEFVDFTLRFDNTGNQLIGNVTIIDNLTTRLEYVPESQTSSVKANFVTDSNEGGSLVLRWEIIEPLQPGQGGVIRFRCKVR